MDSKIENIDEVIPELRHFSRQLVREWGFMNATFAGTNYPAFVQPFLPPSLFNSLFILAIESEEFSSSSITIFLLSQISSPYSDDAIVTICPNMPGIHSSTVHALLEIAHAHTHTHTSNSSSSSNPTPGITATSLCLPLNLDKSSISRLVKKLVSAGEITEEFDGGAAGKGDGRVKRLVLSEKGWETVGRINDFGTQQVKSALKNLPPNYSTATVLDGIRAYATALRSLRLNPTLQPPSPTPSPPPLTPQITNPEITIVEGYRPGICAKTIQMHMDFYTRHSGFGRVFESKLATGLGDLVMRLDGVRSQVWCAVEGGGGGEGEGGRMVGCVWVDGEDLNSKMEGKEDKEGEGVIDGDLDREGKDGDEDEDGIPNVVDGEKEKQKEKQKEKKKEKKKAHLRFFIVGEGMRGKGVGKKLLSTALKFCDEGAFEECQLWTYKGLDAARKLYDREGFACVSEVVASLWGEETLLQHLVRRRGGGGGGGGVE
ncbi:hypothetical protein EG329_013268 [Mollisiaceae sp. DMI_Dod_QoI]|nr:hypothetical protein EG329_013268 [Helotiales sp. DMI_Dod_QoI]